MSTSCCRTAAATTTILLFGRPCKSLAPNRSRFLTEPVGYALYSMYVYCVYNTRITK